MRFAIMGLGGLLVVVALISDWIPGRLSQPGFGAAQWFLTAVGVLLIVAVPASRIRFVRRVGIALAVAYTVLLLCSLALHPFTARPRNSLKGLYTEDEVTGYRLAPNFRGYYDDTLVRAEIRTNSLGHRDDEPESSGSTNILLIGDSYTFGMLLDQTETVDRQIEDLSSGKISAYNAGVHGYGPPAILETLKRCHWYYGTAVVYLFYNDDMREDNLLPDGNRTSYDGYLVTKHRPDGTLFSPAQYNAAIQKIARITEWPHAVKNIFLLRNIWYRVGQLRQRLRTRSDRARTPDHPDLLHGALMIDGKVQGVEPERAAEFAKAMQAEASEQHMTFYVVIVPTRTEAAWQMYSAPTNQYMDRLREYGITIIDVLDRVSGDDYFSHRPHIRASGARRTAEAIVESIVE